MAEKLSFELVAPERLLASIDADMVVIPGSEGDFGVLPQHAPLMALLRPGVIAIYQGDQVDRGEGRAELRADPHHDRGVRPRARAEQGAQPAHGVGGAPCGGELQRPRLASFDRCAEGRLARARCRWLGQRGHRRRHYR